MTHWKIKDLKGVGDVELELDDSRRVFVFFGSNGVGKTKLLECLLLISLGLTENFVAPRYDWETQDYPFKSFSIDSAKLNQITYSFQSTNFYEFFEQFIIKKFSALAFLGATSRSLLFENTTTQPNYFFQTFKETISRQISDSIVSLINISSVDSITNLRFWFTERARSVNPYQKQEDNRQVDIDAVLNALHQLDNRFEKKLSIDGDGNVYLTIDGQERELSELSSGFISVVKIIQSIISAYSAFTNSQDLLNVKGVVLIDEIESHLHIEWQTKIIPTLKDLFPNTTFYIATHSPLVLSQLHEGEAYLLKRDDDGVVRSEVINSPNTRILANVLQDAFGIDLNQLKRDNMADLDQSKAKKKLLALLDDNEAGNNG